jgi:hypothetical protein
MNTQSQEQPWDRATRDAQIREQYVKGLSAPVIARGLNLSAERVRQILRAAGIWKVKSDVSVSA